MRRALCRPRSAVCPPTRWGRWPSTATCARSGTAAPAIVTRVTDTGEPGFDVFVGPSRRRRRSRPRSAPPASSSRRGDGRGDSDRGRRAGCSTATWTRTRSRSRPASSRARSASRRAATSGRKSIIRVLHRGHGRVARKLVGLLVDGEQVPPARGTAIRSGDREIGRGDQQHAVAGARSVRSRSATCTATSSSRGPR